MNKRPKSHHHELEKELMGDIIQKKNQLNTGHHRVNENTKQQHQALARNKMFQIKQGIRRRHPKELLHNYNHINDGMDRARTSWEKAFQYEDDRQGWDEIYTPKGVNDMMANQLGLATTALENFKKSKSKLHREIPVGF